VPVAWLHSMTSRIIHSHPLAAMHHRRAACRSSSSTVETRTHTVAAVLSARTDDRRPLSLLRQRRHRGPDSHPTMNRMHQLPIRSLRHVVLLGGIPPIVSIVGVFPLVPRFVRAEFFPLSVHFGEEGGGVRRGLEDGVDGDGMVEGDAIFAVVGRVGGFGGRGLFRLWLAGLSRRRGSRVRRGIPPLVAGGQHHSRADQVSAMGIVG